jgi:hypothetical protein
MTGRSGLETLVPDGQSRWPIDESFLWQFLGGAGRRAVAGKKTIEHIDPVESSTFSPSQRGGRAGHEVPMELAARFDAGAPIRSGSSAMPS